MARQLMSDDSEKGKQEPQPNLKRTPTGLVSDTRAGNDPVPPPLAETWQ